MINKEKFDLIKSLIDQNVPYNQISKETSLSLGTIYKYRDSEKQFEFKKSIKTNITSTLINEVLSLYIENHSCLKTSKLLNISSSTVNKIVRNNKPELLKCNSSGSINKPKRKYKINEDYFEKIDTPAKAYLLGYLYTDGYNNEKGFFVRLSIHKKDISVLEFFRDQIGLCKTYKFYSYKNMLSLTIGSKKMCSDLSKLGCYQAKTYTLQFPTKEQVPDCLISHFIRGAFDGDGCAYNIKSRNNKGIRISFAGCKTFLNGINICLNEQINLSIKESWTINENKLFGSLEYVKHDEVLLLKGFMYKDSCFQLERKFEKFKIHENNIIKRFLISDDEIIELYKTNKSLDKTAKLLGLSSMTIYNRIKKSNSFLLLRKNLNDDQKLKIVDYYNEGKSNKEISIIFNCCVSTISKQLKYLKESLIN